MTQRDDLVSRLRDESVRLSWNSIERGCADSGIASNVADDAIDMLTDDATALEAKDAEIARLRKVASSEGDAANKLLSRGLDLCDLSEELEAKLDAAYARIIELERQLAETNGGRDE